MCMCVCVNGRLASPWVHELTKASQRMAAAAAARSLLTLSSQPCRPSTGTPSTGPHTCLLVWWVWWSVDGLAMTIGPPNPNPDDHRGVHTCSKQTNKRPVPWRPPPGGPSARSASPPPLSRRRSRGSMPRPPPPPSRALLLLVLLRASQRTAWVRQRGRAGGGERPTTRSSSRPGAARGSGAGPTGTPLVLVLLRASASARAWCLCVVVGGAGLDWDRFVSTPPDLSAQMSSHMQACSVTRTTHTTHLSLSRRLRTPKSQRAPRSTHALDICAPGNRSCLVNAMRARRPAMQSAGFSNSGEGRLVPVSLNRCACRRYYFPVRCRRCKPAAAACRFVLVLVPHTLGND